MSRKRAALYKATVCDGAVSQENASGALLGAARLQCGQVRCKTCLVGDAIHGGAH